MAHAYAAILIQAASIKGKYHTFFDDYIHEQLQHWTKISPEKAKEAITEVYELFKNGSDMGAHLICYESHLLLKHALGADEIQDLYDGLPRPPKWEAQDIEEENEVQEYFKCFFMNELEIENDFIPYPAEFQERDEEPEWYKVHDMAALIYYMGSLVKGEGEPEVIANGNIMDIMDLARKNYEIIGFVFPENYNSFFKTVADKLYLGTGDTINKQRVIQSSWNLRNSDFRTIFDQYTTETLKACFQIATSYHSYNSEAKLELVKLLAAWKDELDIKEIWNWATFTPSMNNECFFAITGTT